MNFLSSNVDIYSHSCQSHDRLSMKSFFRTFLSQPKHPAAPSYLQNEDVGKWQGISHSSLLDING